MGNAGGTPAKEVTAVDEDGNTQSLEEHDKCYVPTTAKGKPCCRILRIIYVILSIIIMLICIALIAVSVSTAIATKTFSIHQSGQHHHRLVAIMILAGTAAITLCVVIYAMMAVIRKQTKPLHASAVVLIILVIIQAIICGESVKLTADDEITLSMSLTESFKMAREEHPSYVKLWTLTQSDLTCCGNYGPDDYRNPNLPPYFPPDVPISCCPNFDSDRSELLQERERESCKARREYHSMGCHTPVLQLFEYTASLVLCVAILVIIFEVLLAIIAAVLSQKKCKAKHKHKQIAIVEVMENKS